MASAGTPMRAPRPHRLIVLLAAVSIQSLWLGCGGGDGGGDITAPEVGTLEVGTETEGVEQDADGYSVAVDGGAPRAIGANGTLRYEGLARGSHRVVMSGAAPNCTVSGNGSTTAQVVRGETVAVRFAVTCAATTGAIQVNTSTGADPDTDGYTLLLDGEVLQPIGPNASLMLSLVPPGAHTVGLSGIAANCQVQGDNPRPVQVTAGQTAAVVFTLACEPPPAATGSLDITTATTGASLPSGEYTVSVDGGVGQPIGSNATITLANLAAGTHAIRLGEVPGNCTVAGENPRNVEVPADGTAEASFAVSCTSVTGSLTVTTRTTGSALDPDGYTATVDPGANRGIGINADRTFDGLAPGAHQVGLNGVAANCQVQGENPRGVTVAAGAVAVTVFEVTCAATSGGLTVTINGLPAAANAAVTVTGPNGFSQQLTATRTLDDLQPGAYTVAASAVSSGGNQFTPSPETQTATVTAGATATASVAYTRAASATLNLRIQALYLTQSVQTLDNLVPMIEGRDGLLRVFAVANETNTAQPDVRVRFFDGSTLIQTFTITASQASTPASVNEGVLTRSWNLSVPGSLIRRGLEIVADVDPANAIAETDEGDNNFPASGARLQVQLRIAPRLDLVLVPVKQMANDLEGDVTEATKDRFLNQIRRMYPIPGFDASVHAVYTTETENPLQANNGNNAWNEVLNEILALQAVEGNGANYYGVVKTGYPDGMNGNGFLEAPAAIGSDDPSDAGRVAAHEMGHNWGRLHSACGSPSDVDPAYPYPGGSIGVHGFDLSANVVKAPSLPDIMGYCGNPWISDYNYTAVMDFRGTALRTGLTAGPQPSLLVWGRIAGGQVILEPAFHVVTRPTPPRRGGAYSVTGYSADGSRLFDFPFEAAAVADDPRGARHFALAIPLTEAAAGRLSSLRLTGPGVQTTASARAPIVPADSDAEAVSFQPSGAGVSLEWNAEAHPMVMVRDPETGEVLTFGRGGRAEVRTGKRRLDVLLSDGVRSRPARIRAPSP